MDEEFLPFDYNHVYSELHSSNVVWLKESKLFFTDNYIVKYDDLSFVLPYRSVIFAYSKNHETIGGVSVNNIFASLLLSLISYILFRDGGKKDIVFKFLNGKNIAFCVKQEDEQNILSLLFAHNNMFIGYNIENINRYNEIRKNYKR